MPQLMPLILDTLRRRQPPSSHGASGLRSEIDSPHGMGPEQTGYGSRLPAGSGRDMGSRDAHPSDGRGSAGAAARLPARPAAPVVQVLLFHD